MGWVKEPLSSLTVWWWELSESGFYEHIVIAGMDDFEGVRSFIKEILHAVHSAANVNKWTMQTGYNFSSWPTCFQLSGWSCTIHQRHTNYVSIRGRWDDYSGSTLRFPSCLILVDTLLLNSHHSDAVMLHTSYYFTKGKSFFLKMDHSLLFKIHQFLKCHIFSSKRHSFTFTISK